MNWKDLLADCAEKFKQVLQLIENCENDPETEPFKSRYEANKLLSELKLKLSNATVAEKVFDQEVDRESVSDEGDLCRAERGSEVEYGKQVNVALALVQYYFSLNYFETEEFSQAIESIDESLSTIENVDDEQITTSLHICCLNQKAVLKSRTESEHQYEEACECLKLACSLFKSWFTEKGAGHPPQLFDHVLRPEGGLQSIEKLKQSFESLHTTSLYLLAQVWKNLGLKTNSTLACYLTLKRILSGQGDIEKIDWVDWSLNCATLSQCFVTDELYSEARECLHAAYCAFEKLQISLQEEANSKVEGPDSDKETSKEKIDHCKADIDRCCVKYAINLLNSSWTFKNIPEHEMRQTYKEAICDIQEATFSPFDLNNRLVDLIEPCFPNVRVNFQVTCSQVTTFEEAREVFLFGQSKCNQAKLFFTENQWCRDYLDLIRDHSQLFKNLANFESDLQRKISMNKKRTDLLTSALTNLSQDHYLQVCRQLQFELGETFSDNSDLQKDLFASKKDVSVASAKKLNATINKSISYFNEFLKTFEDKSGRMPEQFPEMYVRPGLMAKFYMARLFGKLIAPPNVKAENVEKSGSYYQFIADYCDKFEGAFEQMKSEYPICKEMSLLTSAKKNASLSGAKI